MLSHFQPCIWYPRIYPFIYTHLQIGFEKARRNRPCRPGIGTQVATQALIFYLHTPLVSSQAARFTLQKSYKKYRNTSILVWSQELNQTRLVPDPRPACLGTYYLYSQPVDDEATVASAQIRTEKKITLAALLGNFRYNSVSISGSYHRYDTDVADRTRCKYLFLLLCIVDYLYSTSTPLSQ